MKTHRYEQIARELSNQITSGKVSVGDALPTEAALCERYGVSRYTAREALRVLREAGLITRKRRSGSTVTAARTRGAFSLPVGSSEELFRYATGVRMEIESRESTRADARLASLLGGRRGQSWIGLHGIRRSGPRARPACVISVWLPESLAAVARKVPAVGAVIYPHIEQALGVRVAWIRQRIEAVPLSVQDAARLGVPAGSCGLRVLRFYHDARERLLQCSDSRHAGTQFAYEMRLKRD